MRGIGSVKPILLHHHVTFRDLSIKWQLSQPVPAHVHPLYLYSARGRMAFGLNCHAFYTKELAKRPVTSNNRVFHIQGNCSTFKWSICNSFLVPSPNKSIYSTHRHMRKQELYYTAHTQHYTNEL